jgi:predicted nucleic acid-binding OB-fold protein
MAVIIKLLGKWQVKIRRRNYPSIIKTFTERSVTDKYIREIKMMVDRARFQDLSTTANTTLRDILKRYVNRL